MNDIAKHSLSVGSAVVASVLVSLALRSPVSAPAPIVEATVAPALHPDRVASPHVVSHRTFPAHCGKGATLTGDDHNGKLVIGEMSKRDACSIVFLTPRPYDVAPPCSVVFSSGVGSYEAHRGSISIGSRTDGELVTFSCGD